MVMQGRMTDGSYRPDYVEQIVYLLKKKKKVYIFTER